jgi:hypothetical protein
MAALESATWVGDWAWGVPLILANVLLHVVGLNLIGLFVLGDYTNILRRRNDFVEYVAVVGMTALLTISLHALESATWGSCLCSAGGAQRQKDRDALFTGGDDHLRPHECLFESALAVVGCNGSAAGNAAVRTNYRVPILNLPSSKSSQE